ncbi:MAG: hypothetical protein ACE5IB_06675, partial [Candidatus Geothermarchaeales archaeon]
MVPFPFFSFNSFSSVSECSDIRLFSRPHINVRRGIWEISTPRTEMVPAISIEWGKKWGTAEALKEREWLVW